MTALPAGCEPLRAPRPTQALEERIFRVQLSSYQAGFALADDSCSSMPLYESGKKQSTSSTAFHARIKTSNIYKRVSVWKMAGIVEPLQLAAAD